MKIYTYVKEFKKGWKTITAFTLAFLLLASVYGAVLYQPTYQSNAKLLIEEIAATNFVTDLGQNKKLDTGKGDKNPILTQIEILGSHDMANRVYKSLIAQNALKQPTTFKKQEAIIGGLQDSIKLKTPPATDIIEMTVTSDDPKLAKQIAEAYVSEYHAYNIEANKQSIAQAKTYIAEQLEQSRDELAKVREQIRNYRKGNASVDLDVEAANIVGRIAETQNSIANLQSQVNYHNGKVREFSSKLRIAPNNVKSAIDSVALGQNQTLDVLNQRLNEAEQEYAAMKVRYPETTKKMTSMRENIEEIKNEIHQQVATTIGKTVQDNEPMIIKDGVRTKVLNDLIDSQSEMISLQAQKRSLQGSLAQLKSQQNKIPDQQMTLALLTEKEASLVNIVGTLSTKLVEANVRDSGIVSNINIVQMPTLPVSQSFPTLFHILAIMTVTGAIVGCATVLLRYFLRDEVTESDEVETLLNVPVLGSLNWLPDNVYNMHALPDQSSLEYQRIVTALKIQVEDADMNVIGFTSITEGKKRSMVISNIARMLANCNYSVLVVDADFRNGSIADEFGLKPAALPDFRELLGQQSQWINEQATSSSKANDYIVHLDSEKPLYLMTKQEACQNPYEIVTNKFFPLLINRLKGDFDFVLVDTPPMLEISDSLIISRFLDGLVAICGVNSSRSELKKARKLTDDNSVNLIGAIARSA